MKAEIVINKLDLARALILEVMPYLDAGHDSCQSCHKKHPRDPAKWAAWQILSALPPKLESVIGRIAADAASRQGVTK